MSKQCCRNLTILGKDVENKFSFAIIILAKSDNFDVCPKEARLVNEGARILFTLCYCDKIDLLQTIEFFVNTQNWFLRQY